MAKGTIDRDKALQLVTEDKIAKINPEEENFADFYIVTGTRDDYLVILPDFCTCEHFIVRCLKSPDAICYHILAVKMAGKVRSMELDNWLDLLLREH
ncbi:MAG: hypothetical protein ACW98K_07545 [Candidatus Kariarchaeaceae archaeon]